MAHNSDLWKMGESNVRARRQLGPQTIFNLIFETDVGPFDDDLRITRHWCFHHLRILSWIGFAESIDVSFVKTE